MDYTDLFVSRNILFESGRNQFYKNIVYVSREDKEYLKMLGRGMFEGFDEKLLREIEDIKKNSYLCKSLSKESQFQLEEYRHAYWNADKDFINQQFQDGLIVEASVDKKYATGNGEGYDALLHHENVLLYFPVLEGWVHYMLPKMQNETFETREIIKCVSIPAERWKQRRKLLLQVYNHNLIERIQY